MRLLPFFALVVLVFSQCGTTSPATPDGGATGGGSAGGSAGGTAGGTGGGSAGGSAGGTAGGTGGGSAGGAVDAGTALTPDEVALLQARPYRLVVPDSYDAGSAPMPFVLLLHGYTATGLTQDLYFGLSSLARSRGFLLATPDGTVDSLFNHFWNATDACCDIDHSGVDDVKYLTAILNEVRLKYHVDEKRVFAMGHSNGGFMAHRLACDRSARFAGVMALAGDNWKDGSKCQPTEPLAVLQVHGSADAVILYDGGTNSGMGPYPSATDSMKGWAARLGCSSTGTSAGTLDVDSVLLGDETVKTRWTGCRPGGAAELWTIQYGSHLPTLTSHWAADVYDFLMAHPKP